MKGEEGTISHFFAAEEIGGKLNRNYINFKSIPIFRSQKKEVVYWKFERILPFVKKLLFLPTLLRRSSARWGFGRFILPLCAQLQLNRPLATLVLREGGNYIAPSLHKNRTIGGNFPQQAPQFFYRHAVYLSPRAAFLASISATLASLFARMASSRANLAFSRASFFALRSSTAST